MRRREFIATLGGAAVWPIAASAQQPSRSTIGLLGGASPEDNDPYLLALARGLAEAGYVEGKNLEIEYRWARMRSTRQRAMGHHPIAEAIMWPTVTMMMAEAMAMSASKKTLCLRRSILRMRFIATVCRSVLALYNFDHRGKSSRWAISLMTGDPRMVSPTPASSPTMMSYSDF